MHFISNKVTSTGDGSGGSELLMLLKGCTWTCNNAGHDASEKVRYGHNEESVQGVFASHQGIQIHSRNISDGIGKNKLTISKNLRYHVYVVTGKSQISRWLILLKISFVAN
jgi:hypothetical protein